MRIVRKGKTIKKLAKDGRILSGSAFKTLEDAKRLENEYNKCLKKGIPFDVGLKIKYPKR